VHTIVFVCTTAFSLLVLVLIHQCVVFPQLSEILGVVEKRPLIADLLAQLFYQLYLASVWVHLFVFVGLTDYQKMLEQKVPDLFTVKS
jgi:hypothetical protein